MKAPKSVAGGIPAVASSMKHILKETGLLRGTQALLKLNQKTGFDCPGCAWPDPDDERSTFEFCENGAKAIAEEATTQRVTPEFFAKHSVDELSEKSDYELGKSGRLTHPMVLQAGSRYYQPISWEDAFGLIADQLEALESPDQATFYTSGRTSNEAAFLYQLFARIFGTNNLPDCSNMCHESSGTALIESIGFGKGTVTLDDFNHADCIVVMGQNPGTNHPRMLSALQKAARSGCKIITINPLMEAGSNHFIHPQEVFSLMGTGTSLTTHFIPVKINGDLAFLKGIAKELIAAEDADPGKVFDHAFIEEHTHGFSAWTQHLKGVSWELITEESGITREQIRETAKVIGDSKRMIICWAMGLTQHKNAVANIQEAVHLLLLGGHLGRKGAGACPVRGHSNVQGDRTMGICEKMPDAFLDRLGKEFRFSPPRKHGLDTVASIQAMFKKEVRVFIGLGGNFLSATPDTEYVAQALGNCRLTVQISTKLNRSHLTPGETALILPCLGRTEKDVQFVTVENSMGVVHSSEGSLAPASPDLKSEVAIISGIAKTLLDRKPEAYPTVGWDRFSSDYDQVRSHISRVIPGFEIFNERARIAGGFYLPHPVRDRLEFRTQTGKANFIVNPLTRFNLPKDAYLLMTIRSHDQFNTTIYGLEDRYRGISGERRIVMINPDDLAGAGFNAGTMVDLQSSYEGEIREAKKFKLVPYPIPRRCLATYFPEANALVHIRNTADKSNTPVYKSLVVTLRECRDV